MDILNITILADGTIRTETDPISPVNHQSAEQFLKDVATLTGGETVRMRRGNKKTHGHTHVHQGAGGDHGHDH